jgi:uncharacterized Zn-binding protein involved in type VI secretion
VRHAASILVALALTVVLAAVPAAATRFKWSGAGDIPTWIIDAHTHALVNGVDAALHGLKLH